MYAGLRDVKRFTIAATDGDIGINKDFLFDDRAWTVRYMYVDTHRWLPLSTKVLISPISLIDFDTKQEKISVALSKQQVKDSPSVDEHKPVSREYEELLFKHFGYGYYWTGPGAWGEYANPTALAKNGDMPDIETLGQTEVGTNANHLRSIDEIQGYDLHHKDTSLGRIYDLILDSENWEIPLLVIATTDDKKVLVAPKHIAEINWLGHNISSHLTTDELNSCPEYLPELLNDNSYRQQVQRQLVAA
ncbi:PRC-barrel domain containing protein [Paraglaciecola sp. 2405UD69-4]|uniref:PRC-barrel domain containing protein n=1 Tax=Paraglaciecola sp. 2405UD69-4 TaxID=3391836 RepID=UPI0039C8F019